MSDTETGPDRFVICHIAINGQHAHDALDYIENELTAAREKIAELERERYDILNVKTIEGLTCSEWLARTAKAEAERESLRKLAGELYHSLSKLGARVLEWESRESISGTDLGDALIAGESALLSAQNAGIANPSASEPHGGPLPADATIPRP